MRSDAALMFVSSRHRFSLLVVVLLSGCFAELDTGDEPDTTSSSQTCVPGSVACTCYGNGTCDAGLQCIAEISACVPSDCTPGTLQCVCDGALCAQDLECTAGLCIEPDGGSSSGDVDPDGSTSTNDTSATSDGPTSAPSTTDDPSTTMPDASSSSSSDSDSESASESESESDSGDPVCDILPCGQCVQCVAMPGGDCAAEGEACDATEGCEAAAICLASCGVKGLCLDDCCEDKSDEAAAAALALNECRENSCAGTCVDYNMGQCS